MTIDDRAPKEKNDDKRNPLIAISDNHTPMSLITSPQEVDDDLL